MLKAADFTLKSCNVRLWLSEPVRKITDPTLFPMGECVIVPGKIACVVSGGYMVRLETPATFTTEPGGKSLDITVEHWYVFAPPEDIFP